MSTYRYNVSLRIWHPAQDPISFTTTLGLLPKYSDSVGKVRVRKGKPLEFVAKESYWSHEFDCSGGNDVEDYLLQTAQLLLPHRDFFADIESSGGRSEFFIGFFPEDFNCGFELSPDLQSLCAALRLSLSFDVYGLVQSEIDKS